PGPEAQGSSRVERPRPVRAAAAVTEPRRGSRSALRATEPAQALRRAALELLARALEQEPRLAGRQGAAQQEPLAVRALVLLQEAELRKGLHAFCDHFHLEHPRHRQDGRRDRAIAGVVSQIPNE